MKRVLLKTMLCVALPVFVVWAFFSTLIREIGRGFRYAWLDVRSEVASFHRYMRDANEL